MRRAFSVSIFARSPAGRVLLIRHKRLGTWLPVGGELHDGETPLEAAQRELVEETGLVGRFTPLSALHGEPPGFLGYEEHDAGSKGLHLNFCFVADVDGETIRSNGEFDEHVFVADADFQPPCPKNLPGDLPGNGPENVPKNVPENVRQLVARCLARGPSASADLIFVARAWLDRFNARDLDGLLALYADDAVHLSPKLRDRQPQTRGEIRGKTALRAWWQDAMERLPGLRYDEQHLTASAERVFMEYLRRVPGEPDLLVAEVLVVQDGRIIHSRVFHG